MLKVLSFNATGSIIPSFIEIISGASKTADVEKKFFRGVHDPQDVVLIIVDNKMSEIIRKGFKEILYCIDCGNCLLLRRLRKSLNSVLPVHIARNIALLT